jgi:hypothetical protein
MSPVLCLDSGVNLLVGTKMVAARRAASHMGVRGFGLPVD